MGSIFAIIVIALIAVGAMYIAWGIRRTKRNGTETEAIVTRIEEKESCDSEGGSITYDYYVTYSASDGTQYEAKVSNIGFSKAPQVGSRIRIKYLPEKPYTAVWLK